MNPTGVIGSGSGNVMPGQTATAFMPTGTGTGGAGTMNYGNATNPVAATTSANPYVASSSATPSTLTPGGASAAASPASGELSKIYGGDIGALISQYLGTNGGFNSGITQQAITGQVNAMGQQIQGGANNLTSMLSAMGISGGSSGMTSSLTNYMNQATTQENAITSQEYYNMWNQSQQNELSELQSVQNAAGTYEANQFNWQDALGDIIGLGGAAGSIMKGIGGL
jgi:hypothetical protein